MSSAVNTLKKDLNRFFWQLFIGLYLLFSVLIVLAIYQSQNSVISELDTGLNQDEVTTEFAKISALDIREINKPVITNDIGYRKIPLANGNQYVQFKQPFWLLISSPFFIIASLLFFAILMFSRRKALSYYQEEFAVLDKLSTWANIAVIRGEINDIELPSATEKYHEILTAIHKVQQQLYDNTVSDVSSDQNIRSSVLLDQETRIGNRAFFDNRLQAFLKDEDVQGAVLLIQFRELELVQSLYGYQQAMSLLSMLIQVTKQRLHGQPNYFLARRSDFELSLLLPGVFINEVEKLSERLLKNLQAVALPVGINQEEFIHIGVSYFGHDQAAYQVMAEADMALRTAQLQGPSQWFMFEAGELEDIKAKGSLKWRTFLTAAIESNAFVIFFQPVIACDTAQVLHHEVLSKVRDSNGALISARVFLPMARKCALTVKIDLLILEQVCRVLAYEKKQQDGCSINISLDSLLSNDFVEKFLSIVHQFPQLQGQLMIEVSEYQLVSHLGELTPVIHKLSKIGVEIIADKVGQYVVSAHYLNVYPIKAIKLHRSIVLNIDKKIENQVFIQSLKTLATAKNIPIYALGVEHKSEWRTLVQLGVKGGQGHFFTEPVAQVAKAIHLD